MKFLKSTKTTIAGVAMLLGGLALVSEMVASKDYSPEKIGAALTAIAGGIGLITAKDGDKTSKDLGLEPPEPDKPEDE